MELAATSLVSFAGERRGAAVHLCNAYTIALAQSDEDLRSVLNRGALNFPDGMPLIWIARRLGIPLTDRVYGPDLMLETFDRGRASGVRHFLYGASTDVLDDLERHLRNEYPGCVVAGKLSPPFGPLGKADDDLAALAIEASRSSIVWVGLGTPKQDLCVERLAQRLGVPCVAVGAAFNFHTGRVRQAPRVLQRLGLEWAFRLATEPRRLWKRYLVGNTRFVWTVLKSRPRRLDAVEI